MTGYQFGSDCFDDENTISLGKDFLRVYVGVWLLLVYQMMALMALSFVPVLGKAVVV
jgi:hypothetical protein